MRKRLCPVVLLAFIQAAVILAAQTPVPPPTPSPAPPPKPPAATALVTGRVVEGDSGAPLNNAVVMLVARPTPTALAPLTPPQAPPPAQRVMTDGDGRFFFRDLSPGSYSLTVTKPGFIGGAFGQRRPGGPSSSVQLAEGERHPAADLMIWKFAVISGRVTDERGDPLVGVNVRAPLLSLFAGHRLPRLPLAQGGDIMAARAITDDRGEFRFANLMPGDYLVVVPNTLTSQPSGFSYGARLSSQTFLRTMTTVGAAPTVMNDDVEVAAGGDRFVLTSISGLIGGPSADGRWLTFPTTFAPSTPSIGSATVVRAETGRERSRVDLTMRLSPTYRVSGTVTDQLGPAGQNAVHLVPADAADAPLFDVATAVSDNDGTFTMYGVPPGQYLARVIRLPPPTNGRFGVTGGTGAIPAISLLSGVPDPNGPIGAPEPLMSVSVPVTVGDRDIAGLQLTLRPGARVTGRVEFEGATTPATPDQLKMIRVSVELASGPTSYLHGAPPPVAADGTFATQSLWPARYLVRANGPPGWFFKDATYKGRDVSETPLELNDDMTASDVVITFSEHFSQVNGVVQPVEGQPLIRMVVLLFPADARGWIDYGSTSRSFQVASVSQSGTFSMIGMRPGAYHVIAIAEEQSRDWQNPATLQKLVGLAARVQVTDGQTTGTSLTVKQVPK